MSLSDSFHILYAVVERVCSSCKWALVPHVPGSCVCHCTCNRFSYVCCSAASWHVQAVAFLLSSSQVNLVAHSVSLCKGGHFAKRFGCTCLCVTCCASCCSASCARHTSHVEAQGSRHPANTPSLQMQATQPAADTRQHDARQFIYIPHYTSKATRHSVY